MKHQILLGIVLSLGVFLSACNTDQGGTTETADQTKTEVVEQVKTEKVEEDRYGIDVSESTNIGGLMVGDQAPAIVGKTNTGADFSLETSLEKGPVILVFYRGHWCGYCTKHLGELEENMQAITAKGAQVFAITPETETYIEKTVETSKTAIPVIADATSSIMKDYKVAFSVSEEYQQKIIKFKGEALTTFHGQDEAILPIPATYIIGQDGKISYRFYQEDYSKRLEISELLEQLP